MKAIRIQSRSEQVNADGEKAMRDVCVQNASRVSSFQGADIIDDVMMSPNLVFESVVTDVRPEVCHFGGRACNFPCACGTLRVVHCVDPRGTYTFPPPPPPSILKNFRNVLG